MNPEARLLATVTVLVTLAGCAAEEPPPEGSWVEILQEPELQPWARLPESDPGFRSVEVSTDRLVFTFDGPSPIEAFTVVAGGGATDEQRAYIRYVTAVETLADGRIAATTMQARFTQLFREMHVVFHYRPRPAEEYAGVEASGEVAGLRAAASGSCEDRSPCPLAGDARLDFSSGGGACSVSAGGGASLDPYIEPTLEADFELKIGGIDDAFSCLGSTLSFGLFGSCDGVIEKAVLTVHGAITAGYHLQVDAAAEASCAVDIAERLGLGSKVLATFTVVGLPVTIRAEPVIDADVELAIDAGEVDLVAEASFGARSKLGYRDGDWFREFDPYVLPRAEVHTTQAGGISAGASVTVGAKIGVYLLDAAGPYVELTAKVQGDFATAIGGCDYTASVDVDLEAKFGARLQVPVVDIELADVSLDPIRLAHFDVWETVGTLPWCDASMTCTGTGVCRDDVFDRDVCEGAAGFTRCAGPPASGGILVARCTCGPAGFADCSVCMEIPAP